MLNHGVTYLRAVSVTKDAAIDRLNTLCRGSALYPHHETHGLALPFGWTSGIPTELSRCHGTLAATPTNSLSGLSPGWPHAYQRHQRPPPWQKRSQTGTRYHKNKTSTQGYVCLPGQGMHAHNLPSREAPVRGTTKDRIKTPHKVNVVALSKTRFSGTMMGSTSYSSWT